MKKAILITEFMDEKAVERLAAVHPTRYQPDLAGDRTRLLKDVAELSALVVRNLTQVDAGLLSAAPGLVCIGRLGVGLDNIDLVACESRDVIVHSARGANDLSVAEYVVAAAMMLLRNAYQKTDTLIAGKWPRNDCIGNEIAGKTLGIIGFGAIGQLTAIKASCLGMNVLAHDPVAISAIERHSGVEPAGLSELLGRSDVASLHVPYMDSTHHLINETTINLSKPGMMLINAARGGVIDETALIRALRDGRIGGAVLDVFEHEPLAGPHSESFRDLDNLILTPHIAGVTRESNQRVSNMIADKVLGQLAATE